MRTSGRNNGSETLMFIAPAVILGGFIIWLYGDTQEVLRFVDRTVLHVGHAAYAWVAALMS